MLAQGAAKCPQPGGIWKTATNTVPPANLLDPNGAKMTVDAGRTHNQVGVPDAFLKLALAATRPTVVTTEFSP
jgi:hypothetical protein